MYVYAKGVWCGQCHVADTRTDQANLLPGHPGLMDSIRQDYTMHARF
jgi:hypothetical protein